jgi:hypothetical protein
VVSSSIQCRQSAGDLLLPNVTSGHRPAEGLIAPASPSLGAPWRAHAFCSRVGVQYIVPRHCPKRGSPLGARLPEIKGWAYSFFFCLVPHCASLSKMNGWVLSPSIHFGLDFPPPSRKAAHVTVAHAAPLVERSWGRSRGRGICRPYLAGTSPIAPQAANMYCALLVDDLGMIHTPVLARQMPASARPSPS